MSGRKRKKISCPFSSSKKPKRWKSDGTEEFSVERALHDRGSYYNQDECAFCPSVFHLFAGSEHSQDTLAGPHACSTSRFSLSGFLRHGYWKYLEIKEVKMSNIIPILPTKSSAWKKSHQFAQCFSQKILLEGQSGPCILVLGAIF